MSTETELEILKTVVTKIDSSLEKMSEVSNNISKILAVHEQRINQLEKYGEDRFDDIKELHIKLNACNKEVIGTIHAMEERLELKFQRQAMNNQEQHNQIQKEIQEDIDEIVKRLQKLENWRWWMMGVGVGFGVLAAKVIPLLA